MKTTIERTITLESTECCNCGVTFAMPEYLLKRLRETEAWFYCPNGHQQHFTESEATRLKEELTKEREKAERLKKANVEAWQYADEVREERDKVKRQLSTTRGVLTKTKKRIANGVCPCCHRHFANLEKHMGTKHPQYDQSEESQP